MKTTAWTTIANMVLALVTPALILVPSVSSAVQPEPQHEYNLQITEYWANGQQVTPPFDCQLNPLFNPVKVIGEGYAINPVGQNNQFKLGVDWEWDGVGQNTVTIDEVFDAAPGFSLTVADVDNDGDDDDFRFTFEVTHDYSSNATVNIAIVIGHQNMNVGGGDDSDAFDQALDVCPNPAVPAELTVIKNVEGGALSAGDFDISVDDNDADPNDVLTDPGVSGAGRTYLVASGTYTVSEDSYEDYTTAISCNGPDGTTSGTVTLGEGEPATCTVTNTFAPPGTIVIEKQTVPDGSSQSFEFNPSWSETNLFLSDGDSQSFELAASEDPYSISEEALAGWDSTSAVCTSSDDGTETIGSISLQEGETVTCVFTNTQRGKIIVEKQTLPDGSAADFTFTGDAAGTISDGETIEVPNLVPGTYSSTESALSGWDLTGLSCDDSNSSGSLETGTATFNVEAGETVKCTFTNTKLGVISVTKYASPDGNFGFTLTGPTPGSTTLSNGGSHDFDDLTPGNYSLTEDDAEDYQVACTKGDSSVDPNNIALGAGEQVSCIFLNGDVNAVSGKKYEDMNADGTNDEDPAPDLPWVIEVRDSEDELVASTTTDEFGNYSISGLFEGSYTVCEVEQDGWSQSAPSSGATCENGSNGYSITITNGDLLVGKDFGNYQRGSISGAKFADENGNGSDDDDWTGLGDWTIRLLDATGVNELSTMVTAGDGSFSFTNLLPGVYRLVEVLQVGWSAVSPVDPDYLEVTVTSGNENDGNNFVNFEDATVTGVKFEDENGDGERHPSEPTLEGWEIVATKGEDEKTTTTNGDGEYSFTFGPAEAGVWTISETAQAGWVQTLPDNPDTYSVVVESGVAEADLDFGNFRVTTIQAIKYWDHNENGERDEEDETLSGWEFCLSLIVDETTEEISCQETDEDGQVIWMEDIAPGDYQIDETGQVGWRAVNPADAEATVVVNESGATVTAEFGNSPDAVIRGEKWEDENGNGVRDEGENGIAGWTVALGRLGQPEQEGGEIPVEILALDLTGANGEFDLPAFGAGDYMVFEEDRDGALNTYPGPSDYFFDVFTGVDLGEITLDGDSFFDVTIGESFEGAITIDNQERDINFGNFIGTTIRGFKWNDLDADGEWDENESAIPGWAFGLGWVDDEAEQETVPVEIVSLTLTGGNGQFAFPILSTGHYRIFEANEEGWLNTYPASQSADQDVTSEIEDLPDMNTDSFFDVFVDENGIGDGTTITQIPGEVPVDIEFGNHSLLVITNIQSANVTTSSATITWDTNRDATSRVVYGTNSVSGSESAPNYGYSNSTPTTDESPKVSDHSVGLSGLNANTTYFYRVISAASPEVVSDQASFTTSSAGTPPPSGNPGGNPGCLNCLNTAGPFPPPPGGGPTPPGDTGTPPSTPPGEVLGEQTGGETETGETSSTGGTTPTGTGSAPSGEVLGESVAQAEGEPVPTPISAPLDEEEIPTPAAGCYTILGICWYWWLLIIVILAFILWWWQYNKDAQSKKK